MRNPTMKGKYWITVGLVVILAVGGWWFFHRKEDRRSNGAMRSISVTEGGIEQTVDATGSVAPLNRVEIKPPIQGRIEKLLADEGDHVKQGQIVAWMSSSDRAAILDAARAKGDEELKRWQDAYKPTPVVAPLSGVVILRNVVVGQTVESSTVLFAMSDNLVVVAEVDESDIGRVHQGMPARITLDAYPDRPTEGRVFDILYEGKNVSNVIQYGVKIKIDTVPAYFRSQMTANVNFIVNRKEQVLLIPANVVREGPGGVKQVLVPDGDGKPVSREIQTGIETGELVEIISGLRVGEKVLMARGRYVPQQAPQSSPLTFGGRRSSSSDNFGQAPRPRRNQ